MFNNGDLFQYPEVGDGAQVLTLPIHDLSSGEIYNSVTHPDVIYIKDGWNGYRYWMAITPYPDVAREQPCIYASRDGVTWVVPQGLVNPIAVRAEAIAALGAGSWLADPDLVFANGVLYCFYCRFDAIGGWQFVRRSSTSGTKWSEPLVVLTGNTTYGLSPAFIHEGGNNLTVFYVRGVAAGTPTIKYRTSSNLGQTWGEEQSCTVPKCTDDRPDFWHMDAVKVGPTYHALFLSKVTAESWLWYYTSTDKINWTLMSHEPAIPYSGIPMLDGASTYRSCLVPKEGGRFDIYYTGVPRGGTSDDPNYWPDLAVTASTATDFFTATGGAHLLDNGDQVVFLSGTPPGNITIGTTYYVRDRTNNTFKVAATSGGAAIDLITTNGSGIRASRNPWRVALLRNVELPMVPRVLAPRKAYTNVNQGGMSVMAPAASIHGVIATWPTANLGFANRFSIQTPVELRYASIPCTVASGNIEVGILRMIGGDRTSVAPLITSGVIACPAPSGGRIRIDLGKFVLPPGEYWAWFWCDNTTATFPATGLGYGGTFHVAQYSAAAAGGKAMPVVGASLDATGGRAISHLMFEGDYA